MTIVKRFQPIILALIFFGSSYFLKMQYKTPKLQLTKEQTAININSDLISIFSLGQKRLLSSLLWVTTLLESDISHHKIKDKNSWMFYRFKSISDLDYLFLKNYQFGAQYLNIIKDDLKGSELIFDKGLSFFPMDFELNLNSGFLQAFELKNYKKAYLHYSRIANYNRAPKYLPSLLSKLTYSKTGNIDLTIQIIKDMFQKTLDPVLRKKFETDLYALKAQKDLSCLNTNSNKDICDLKDFSGNLYIKKGNKYVAPKTFKKYKLFL